MTNRDLLRQYTNTGAILPETQANKLNQNLLKTYLRRRINQAQQSSRYELKDYEFVLLAKDEPMLVNYLKDFDGMLYGRQLDALPQHILSSYLQKRIKEHMTTRVYYKFISLDEFEKMDEDTKWKFVEATIENDLMEGYNVNIETFYFPYITEKRKEFLRNSHLRDAIENRDRIQAWHWYLLTPEIFDEYKEVMLVNSYANPEYMSEELKNKWVMSKAELGLPLYFSEKKMVKRSVYLNYFRYLIKNYNTNILSDYDTVIPRELIQSYFDATIAQMEKQQIPIPFNTDVKQSNPELYNAWVKKVITINGNNGV